jgi:hypothetical protein
MRATPAEDGTMTWSARRKRPGQRIFLTAIFHRRESRGESVVVSVPNRNAVPESFEASKAIQKEAFR